MAVNRIGTFNFTSLSRPPELVQQTFVTRTRPGINGVSIQRLGIHARSFQVLSKADTLTLADAWDLYDDYRRLTESLVAVPVIWSGFPMSSLTHLFFVLRAEPAVIRSIVAGHGGLCSPSTARAKVHCVWTLQPQCLA